MKNLIFIIIFNVAFLIPNSFCFAQNKNIDSLLALLKKDKADTNKVKHLNSLGWQLMNQNPDTAIILSNQALDIITPTATLEFLTVNAEAENKEIRALRAKTFGNLGVYNSLKANYSSALDYYFKALKINEELKNKKGMAMWLGNVGIVYVHQSDYPKALEYYLKALKIAEELGDKYGIATHLGNIGNIYFYQKDYAKALNYYSKALKLSEQLANKSYIGLWISNIGSVYFEQASFLPIHVSRNLAGQTTRK